jgi:hypothetical protein
MLAQIGHVLAQPAQVDDALETSLLGCPGHVLGSLPIGTGEIPLGGLHGMNKIIGGPTPLAGAIKRILIHHINGHSLEIGMAMPRMNSELRRIPTHSSNPIAAIKEERHEPGAHIPIKRKTRNHRGIEADSLFETIGPSGIQAPKKLFEDFLVGFFLKAHNERLPSPNGRCPQVSGRPQKQCHDFALGMLFFLQIQVVNLPSLCGIYFGNFLEQRKRVFFLHRVLLGIDEETHIHFVFRKKLLRFRTSLSSGPVVVPVNLVRHDILLFDG